MFPNWTMSGQFNCWNFHHHRWVCLLGPLQKEHWMQMVNIFHFDQSLPAFERLSSPGWGDLSRMLVWTTFLHPYWSCMQCPGILLWNSGSRWETSLAGNLSSALSIFIWMSLDHLCPNHFGVFSVQNLSRIRWVLWWLLLLWEEMHCWCHYNWCYYYNNSISNRLIILIKQKYK